MPGSAQLVMGAAMATFLFVLRFKGSPLLVELVCLPLDLLALLGDSISLAFQGHSPLLVGFRLLLRTRILQTAPARALDRFALPFDCLGLPAESHFLRLQLLGLLMERPFLSLQLFLLRYQVFAGGFVRRWLAILWLSLLPSRIGMTALIADRYLRSSQPAQNYRRRNSQG